MSMHSHGDVDQDAIDLLAEVSRRGRRGVNEFSRTIGEMTRAVLSQKVPGETYAHASGRALRKARDKAHAASKSPDEIAKDVLAVQAIYEARCETAMIDPTRPGTPDARELKAQAGIGRAFRRAYEARLGHDIETGQPINAKEHAWTVDPALKHQAMLMERDGTCHVSQHAQGLYEAATGEVDRREGQQTRQGQLKQARRRSASQQIL